MKAIIEFIDKPNGEVTIKFLVEGKKVEIENPVARHFSPACNTAQSFYTWVTTIDNPLSEERKAVNVH